MLDQLGEIVLGDASGAGLFQPLRGARPHFFAPGFSREAIDQALQVDPVVPDFKRPHESVLGHLLAIGAHRGDGRSRRIVLAQTKMTSGDDHARGQTFEVPFPGRGQRLIEVIDVEDDIALGSGKAAEVHQMGVAASLHSEPGVRRMGQVSRHQRRRAAVKRERRLKHSPMANRDEIGHPALV